MALRPSLRLAFLGFALALAGCEEGATGPIRISAVGAPPQLVNPNLQPLDAASAFLVEATAQGLVRFNGVGEIEPALAQSWIVSDDGLRYTFRIRRASWADGSPVTAEQVAARLRAAVSRASRNPYKPVLGAIVDTEAMTDRVLEISLTGPRPNFLELLAQPELSIIVDGEGTGPFVLAEGEAGAAHLEPRQEAEEEEDDDADRRQPDLLLRGERAAIGVARFAEEEADLVVGGTIGDLAVARAARLPANRLVVDPTAGLLGLAFVSVDGPLADPAVRNALSMAIDRGALVAALAVPGLQPRLTLTPPLADELPAPTTPAWAASPMPMRRELAGRTIDTLEAPLRLRVAVPEGAGYRLIFAQLRRDWRVIGVEAERVVEDASAELRLVDRVAPGALATWYFRQFDCGAGPVCDADADAALAAARTARTAGERRTHLATADRLLAVLTPFISISSPVRWSLVSPRLTGFRPNGFARHPAGTLIAEEP